MVVVGLSLSGNSGTTLYSLEKTPRSKRGELIIEIRTL